MRTDLKQLQNQLLSELSEPLKTQGFKRTKQSFVRDTPGAKQIFHLAFIDHKDDFDITADVAVRHHPVEELVNEFNPLLREKEKSQTATIGIELGNLSQGKQRRWTVSQPSDIPPVSASLLEAFQSMGLPYLERYTSLDDTFSVLSADDPAAWLHSPIHHERAKRAIAAAFLLRLRDRFEQLVDAKARFLESRKDFGLEGFKSFADALEKRWSSSQERKSNG